MYNSSTIVNRGGVRKASSFASNHFNEQIQQMKSFEAKSSHQASIQKKVSTTKVVNQITYPLSYLKTKFKVASIEHLSSMGMSTHISKNTFDRILAIDSTMNIEELIESLFKIFTDLSELDKIKHAANQSSPSNQQFDKEVTLPLRSRQTKMIRLVKDDSTYHHSRGKSKVKFNQIQGNNQTLKKEIFQLKQEKLHFERRMLELIQEYKNRKNFYLAEIKKLTDIINMSSFDVRSLVLEKTKVAQQLYERNSELRQCEASAMDSYVPEPTRHSEFREMNHRQMTVSSSAKRDKSGGEVQKQKEYNTEIRILKGINSVQHFEQIKNDNNALY